MAITTIREFKGGLHIATLWDEGTKDEGAGMPMQICEYRDAVSLVQASSEIIVHHRLVESLIEALQDYAKRNDVSNHRELQEQDATP